MMKIAATIAVVALLSGCATTEQAGGFKPNWAAYFAAMGQNYNQQLMYQQYQHLNKPKPQYCSTTGTGQLYCYTP